MNIYTNLLSLHGYITDPHLFDEAQPRYSQGYGNRVASEKFFAPLGHAQSDKATPAAAPRDCDGTVAGCA
ncbi:hypothetical protein ACFOLC_14865 [Lysobacter cavernae]|uniref:Uncharacterized protein n=1 Tax=Lysobacter cavernae TaxID=1685901 RepID=A0ABV7RRR0_9GAMM